MSMSNNGTTPRETLYAEFPEYRRQIGALCTGTQPNMFIRDGIFYLTRKGYDTLVSEGGHPIVQREVLPDYIRTDSIYRQRTRLRREQQQNSTTTATVQPTTTTVNTGTTGTTTTVQQPQPTTTTTANSLLTITVNRNNNCEIICKLHPEFKQWLNQRGRVKNFSENFGRDYVHNWDATTITKYIDVNLDGIDIRQNNILGEGGLNPLILKLAGATDDGTYKVNYRVPVSYEKLQRDCNQFADKMKSFYQSYVRPVKLMINVQFWG